MLYVIILALLGALWMAAALHLVMHKEGICCRLLAAINFRPPGTTDTREGFLGILPPDGRRGRWVLVRRDFLLNKALVAPIGPRSWIPLATVFLQRRLTDALFATARPLWRLRREVARRWPKLSPFLGF